MSDQSADSMRAVTPSDTVALGAVTSKIWVGGAGNVTVEGADGAIVTFTAVPAGSWLHVRTLKIRATLTTATLMVAVF